MPRAISCHDGGRRRTDEGHASAERAITMGQTELSGEIPRARSQNENTATAMSS
jgi:hypothetical protein